MYGSPSAYVCIPSCCIIFLVLSCFIVAVGRCLATAHLLSSCFYATDKCSDSNDTIYVIVLLISTYAFVCLNVITSIHWAVSVTGLVAVHSAHIQCRIQLLFRVPIKSLFNY
jgi:hypothetical protein